MRKQKRTGQGVVPVRPSFLCNLPFAKSRSRLDRSQRKAKLHKRIVSTNYAVPTGALDSKASRLLLETMADINKKMQATILMVTHDPFSASFCERILFLKDGKIFNEIFKGEKNRKDFFNEILDILTLLGGEVGNVR